MKFLQEGLSIAKNKNSVELKTQLNYLRTLSKKNDPLGAKTNPTVTNSMKKQDEDIYYSDDEQDGGQLANGNRKKSYE